MTDRSRRYGLFMAALLVLLLSWQSGGWASEDYEVLLNIVSINDMHGEADPNPEQKFPGAARVVTAVKELETDYPGKNIVVSAGDNYSETVISFLSKGKIIDDVFKSIGVLYSAVGNHEFDWVADAPQLFAVWENEGGFRYLAANIRNKSAAADAYTFTPTGAAELNGIKVGFIGCITDEMPLVTSDTLRERYEFTETTAIAWRQYADELRNDGCDIVVALTHNGTEQADDGTISNEVADQAAAGAFDHVDAVLSAHTHEKVSGEIDTARGKIPVVQGRKGGEYLSVLQLRELKDGTREIVPLLVHVLNVAEDEETKRLVAGYNEKYKDEIEKPITTLGERLEGKAAVAAWGCDSLAAYVLDKTGNRHIVIQNTGSFRTDYMSGGTVTYGDMYRMLPYESRIVTMKFSGADLVALLEEGDSRADKGLTYAGVEKSGDGYILSKEGTAIDPAADYLVLTNDFVATGGDGYDMSKAREKEEWLDITREALCEYFTSRTDNTGSSSSGCATASSQLLALLAAATILKVLTFARR